MITGYLLAVVIGTQPTAPLQILNHYSVAHERRCVAEAGELNRKLRADPKAIEAGAAAVCLAIQHGEAV
jgi:hypothetical protein